MYTIQSFNSALVKCGVYSNSAVCLEILIRQNMSSCTQGNIDKTPKILLCTFFLELSI